MDVLVFIGSYKHCTRLGMYRKQIHWSSFQLQLGGDLSTLVQCAETKSLFISYGIQSDSVYSRSKPILLGVAASNISTVGRIMDGGRCQINSIILIKKRYSPKTTPPKSLTKFADCVSSFSPQLVCIILWLDYLVSPFFSWFLFKEFLVHIYNSNKNLLLYNIGVVVRITIVPVIHWYLQTKGWQ